MLLCITIVTLHQRRVHECFEKQSGPSLLELEEAALLRSFEAVARA